MTLPKDHRVQAADAGDLLDGEVHFSPAKSLWLLAHATVATVGVCLYLSWTLLAVFAPTGQRPAGN